MPGRQAQGARQPSGEQTRHERPRAWREEALSLSQLRRARVGISSAFLLVGVVYFTWAARLPAVKDDLGLSNGELAVALIGLEAGALVGLRLGGVLVPRTGSRAALAAGLGVGRAGHLLTVAAAVALGAVAASRLLLPSSIDASPAGPSAPGHGRSVATAALAGWLRGRSGRVVVLGGLAFCVELAQNSGSTWGAVWLRDAVGASASTAAAGLAVLMAGTTAGQPAGDRLRARFGPARLFRAGALLAGAGFGAALLTATPAAGIAGLALLGAGTSVLLPLAISAAGALKGETAPAVARVATLGCLGSFTAPVLVGGLAGALSLAAALALPALLLAGTALPATAVQPAAELRAREPAPTQSG